MVVVARLKRGVELVDGFAGCPVCHLEARFADGDLLFPTEAVADRVHPLGAPAPHEWTPDLERTIALLGLAEPGGAVVLSGRYAALAERLVERVDVGVVLMGTGARRGRSESAALVRGVTPIAPFTDGTFRAVAVDVVFPETLLDDLVRTVAIGGRMLATRLHRVPRGLTELARDDHEWVAAREVTGAIVELSRRR